MSAHAALLTVAACAAGPRPTAPARGPTPEVTRPGSAYVLTAAELQNRGTRSLRDLVSNRWPAMFWGEPRGFGVQSAARTATVDQERFGVYEAWGGYVGGPEFLAEVHPGAVRQLRRLTSEEEFTRFGRRHAAGAIIVTWVDPATP